MLKLSVLLRAVRRSQVRAIQNYAVVNKENAKSFVNSKHPAHLICRTNISFDQRNLSTTKSEQGDTSLQESPLDSVTFERVCAQTLDSLCEHFDELLENATDLNGSDVSYSDGVLTVNLGKKYGTYVINRQTPNKQIWLSSPTSGPKRYDFVGPKTAETGQWIYKHNNESMHELLQRELKLIFKNEKFDFLSLPYAR